jgi:NDP-sugar pyrophosphorylase family protein
MIKPHFFLSNLFRITTIHYFEVVKESANLWDPLNRLEIYMKSIQGLIESAVTGVHLKNPETIVIGKGCTFGPFVSIEGPVVIGEGCEIRSGAYIRPGSLIGDGVVIGHGTEIVRSIVFNNAALAHFNYVGDSIIGEGVNFGAGSKCANFRLDGGVVNIRVNGKKIATDRRKLGSFIGDKASIGCNAVLNPGTILLPKENVFPGSVV